MGSQNQQFYSWLYFCLVNINLSLLTLPVPLSITRPVDFIGCVSVSAMLADLPMIILNIHLGRVQPGRVYIMIVTFKEIICVAKAAFISPFAFGAFADCRMSSWYR